MKTKIPAVFPSRLKLVAWLNIAIQVSFPIASVFTPVISSSQDNIHFLTKENVLTDRQTQVYILAEGENTLSVAKKYNMSVDALRRLNQFRTFAHGFDKLQAGDELDVPMAALPTIEWHTESKSETPQNNQEQNLANFASQAGQFLSNNPSKDTASALARGMASATASSYLQQWFSHVGNSRIQLDVDKSFALKNSQVDLLVPLYDKKDKLLFTQGSLHRTDERTQTNLGLGMRWFQPDYMIGANSFLDYDLSRSHSRMGLGVEYRRDYLKLAANSYHRLSNWKDSKDLEDYQERAANGWDLRSEAWLPSYPHVGAKLSYEQYYGDEVGLFGSDKRRANPQAVTVGLNYTPFPLLTINAERRRGTSDERDSKISLQLNYQLGTAWQQQINPDNVSALRTLQGSRYDFVDRNNNIVLEYRKKEVINLSVSSPITGYAGEEKPLTFTVNSKYGLDHVEWSAPQLIAANGQLLDNKKGQYSIKLPEYQTGKQATNSYVINAVAIDKQGNRSAGVAVQVTVTQAAIFAGNSDVSPTKFTLAANGKAQQKVTFIIKDKNNQLVDISAEEISLAITSVAPKHIRAMMKKASTASEKNDSIKISEFTRTASGQYNVTITAGTKPEKITLTPTVRDVLLKPITLTLEADNQTAHLENKTVVKDNAIANSSEQNQVKIVISDALGHKLSGYNVKLTATKPAKVAAERTSNEQGEILIPVTSTQAGKATLMIDYGGATPETAEITFVADHSTAKINADQLTVTPSSATANGVESIEISAKVTDKYGNIVPNFEVKFDSDKGRLTSNTKNTDENGIATTSITNTVAGNTLITAMVGIKPFSKSIIFTSNKNTVKFASLKASTLKPQIADGNAKIDITAVLVDANGNPLKETYIDWVSDKATQTLLSPSKSKTDNDGQTTISVKSTLAGSHNITAKVDGTTVKKAIVLEFIADKTTAIINTADLLISTSDTIADGITPKVITAKVTDAKGNILSGIDVDFITTGGKFTHGKTDRTITAQTHKDGLITVKLTNTKAEAVEVTATVGRHSVKQTSQFIANKVAAKITTIKGKTTTAIADGSDFIEFEAIVTDVHNNPIKNATVNWASNHSDRDVKLSPLIHLLMKKV